MTNFTKRLIFGILYVLLIVVATSTNIYMFYGLFVVFMSFSIYEFQKMLDLTDLTPVFVGVSMLTASLLNHVNYPKLGSLLIILSLLGLFSTFIMTLFDEKKKAIPHLGKITLTIIYTVVPFLLLVELASLKAFNPKIVLGSFILVWTSDTFAYIVGKQFGKHKLFERISPKKTIEGFAGGAFFTLIAAYIIALFFKDNTLLQWVIIAVIVAVFGVVGDLVESMFKRQTNVKDSSNLIPGHGGFLDRLDSIIFAGPFIFAFIYLTNLIN